MRALVLALAVAAAPACVLAVSPTEKSALVDIYTGLGGKTWVSNAGWLTSGDPCDWYGVGCGSDEAVVLSLDLGDNNATGTIPASIGQLWKLQ